MVQCAIPQFVLGSSTSDMTFVTRFRRLGYLQLFSLYISPSSPSRQWNCRCWGWMLDESIQILRDGY